MNGIDPATLGEAIALQPTWLKIWMYSMGAVNMAAILFLFKRREKSWGVRLEAWTILAAFFAAGVMMNMLYAEYGYVRLLGLAHLVFWTPAWLWIWSRRADHAPADTLFGKYVLLYLTINGIALAIDTVDVVRYFTGTA
ncbi:MAG: hypothetical protein AAF067_06505 [Pseudomonadota bacterium]